MRYDLTDDELDPVPVQKSVTPRGYDVIPVPTRPHQRKCLYCHQRMTLGLCTNDDCERNNSE